MNAPSDQESILLVDDNPANLQVLFQTLGSLGCKLLIAKNGEGALAIAHKALPDLILLDIMMPGIDGFEVCRRLKADLATAKILLSNRRFAHSCFHAQQAGEKCIKALWYLADSDPWGHSIRRLIEEIPEVDTAIYKDLKKLAETGAKLDRFYIPTRYPNGLTGGTPADLIRFVQLVRRLRRIEIPPG